MSDKQKLHQYFEAMKLLAFGDWSAISGAGSSSQFASEILDKIEPNWLDE